MSVFTTNSIIGNISGSVKGLCKNQDKIFFGKSPEYNWSVVLDGHGTNQFINLLSEFNWEEIMSAEDPSVIVINKVKSINGMYGKTSGSTMSLMKMFKNRVETYNIGDSITAIYKNDTLVYKNRPHNKDNELELERLKDITVIFSYTNTLIPHICSSTALRGKYNSYCSFNNHTKIALTQALGHNDITGYCCEKHVETYDSTDKIRCVSGSDGFFDMFLFSGEDDNEVEQDKHDILTKTSEELLDKIEKRWKQKWEFYYDLNNPELKYNDVEFPSNSYDDVSIVVCDNYN